MMAAKADDITREPIARENFFIEAVNITDG